MRKKNDGRGRLGGRTVGTPNKVTADIKSWIQKVIEGNRKQFEKDLKLIAPVERLKILSNLLQYVTPKMQSISANEMLEAEYKRLEILLKDTPDVYIEEISNKIIELQDGQKKISGTDC